MIAILVRLTGSQKTELENISAVTGASQAFLIRKAIDEFLDARQRRIKTVGSLNEK